MYPFWINYIVCLVWLALLVIVLLDVNAYWLFPADTKARKVYGKYIEPVSERVGMPLFYAAFVAGAVLFLVTAFYDF